MNFLEIFEETKFFHAKHRTVTMNKDSAVWPAKSWGMVVEIWINMDHIKVRHMKLYKNMQTD